jgi:hypothetical protein
VSDSLAISPAEIVINLLLKAGSKVSINRHLEGTKTLFFDTSNTLVSRD